MLSLGALFIVAGRVGDIVGRRRAFVFGCALFTATMIGAALAPTLPVLVAFRVLQGAGAGLLVPVGIALVTNGYPQDRRARAPGLTFALANIGTALGPFRRRRHGPGPRWIFWLLVPFSTAGWSAASTIALLAAGAVLLGLFVVRERHTAYPLIDLSLFRNLPFDLVTFLGSVCNIAYGVVIVVVSLYLQQVRGLTPLQAGTVFLGMASLVAVAGPVGARLQPHFRPTLITAFAGTTAASHHLADLRHVLVGVRAHLRHLRLRPRARLDVRQHRHPGGGRPGPGWRGHPASC
jgi:MFS family permease